MILHHVTQRPRLVEIACARADPLALGDRDLHVIDIVAVPDRLDERVGETEDQQVLDRLLAEVVIDAVDLVLAEILVQLEVQHARALEILAEGLLDHDAMLCEAAAEAGIVKMRYDRQEIRRTDRQIEYDVLACTLTGAGKRFHE